MNLRQFEKDERPALRRLVEQANRLHAEMGGRDERPERIVLLKVMEILQAEIDRPNGVQKK